MSKNKKKIISFLCSTILLGISVIPTISSAATMYTQSVKTGIDSFPQSYQTYLRELQDLHPNWTFDAYYTGINWGDLVNNETKCGQNRIINSANPLWKSSCGNVATGYACASESIVKYYLDPRNFIGDDVKVFQFLEISYNEKIHTIEGIKSTVANSFLNADVTFTLDGQRRTMSYAQIILEAAKQSQMSPYSIATKIIQEVGSKGSASVSGTYAGYEGYYNFYNYGASDGGSPIAKGLQYAKDHGWNNQYTAIVDGAKLLADSYTNAGQNTAYFYKWDVVGTSILKAGQTQQNSSKYMFNHQYMTNIQDPTSQSRTTYNTYSRNDILNASLNFVIPVYDNMPGANKLPSTLTVDDGALYYMIGTDVRVRSQPNTSGSVLATMTTLDEIVAVVERKCSTDSSGLVWDKVKLSSGVVGYMASKYLLPCAGNDDIPTPPAPPAEEVKVEGTKAITLPNMTANKMAEKMGLTSYEIHKNGTILPNTDPVGTGYVLKDKASGKEYTVSVKGDVYGDAEINSADLLATQKHLLGVKIITDGAIFTATDVVGADNTIDSADLLKIQKYLLGVSGFNV